MGCCTSYCRNTFQCVCVRVPNWWRQCSWLVQVNASEASTRTADVVASHQQKAIAAKDEARRVQEQSDAAVAELVSSLNDSAHTIKELRRQLRAAHQQIEHLRAGAPA